MRRTGVRESPCSGISSSTKFSLNSCSHSWISLLWVNNGSLRSIVVSSLFGFWFLVGLDAANNGSLRSIISSTFGLDTSTEWESIPLRSSLSGVSLPLDVVVGEVDVLEEDVGWLIFGLEGVIEVEWWEPEEDLVDKPGTTIGTKFSVLHCMRIPFSMICGLWPLIHS